MRLIISFMTGIQSSMLRIYTNWISPKLHYPQTLKILKILNLMRPFNNTEIFLNLHQSRHINPSFTYY